MAQRFHSQTTQASKHAYMLKTTQVPPAYPPSVRMMEDLAAMNISQMELQKHHRGKKVIVRVMTPPDTLNAIMAVVEDEEGTAVLLQLYHQPKPPEADAEDILHKNMVLVIKEPFFKAAGDGAYSIRVDHVSDIVWLRNGDTRIPPKWSDQPSEPEASAVIRRRGNVAVNNKQWVKAEYLYTQALRTSTTSEEEQLAYLNRALVHLRLGRPEKALNDTLAITMDGQGTEKRLFREARALYELGRFSESIEKLRILTESYPQNEDARTDLRRAEKRAREAQTGEYDFESMYKQAEATPPIIDCATYSGPVTVRDAGGRGKGLFTTKPVKAGDLLLCEKAFAYCYADKDDPIGMKNMCLLLQLDTKRAKLGGQAHLLTQIVQKLYHSPSLSEGFKALHPGDYTPVTVSNVDGQPVVDTFLVDRVINTNSFGAPRTTHSTHMFIEKKDEEHHSSSCGIWLLASRINHDCLGNCRRSFIGDMQIVRACQDIPPDTELSFPYQSFAPRTTYEETQKVINNWGFICTCSWCLDRKSTKKKILVARNNLLKDLDAALGDVVESTIVDPTLLARVRRLLGQTGQKYSTRPGALRLELRDGYFTLGFALISLGQLCEGIEAILQGFEALGFETVACPPRGGEKKLEIRRWGHVESACMRAFLQLYEAYKSVAPELCPKAKEYAKIVYCICTGTDVAFSTVSLQLT
ncbi:hypothetical protein GGR55DRAFT_687772 [Xylaria sp. FL0064]|nr:hypothetical protein GGR55DRAFT_687772 [Xylaria sp. FL0064]